MRHKPAAHSAVSPVQFDATRRIWLLTTAHNSYAIGVDSNGTLQNLYWGGPLWRIEDIPAAVPRRDVSSFDPRQMIETEEYLGWGGPRYYEPALKLTRANGDRDLVLRYASHQINVNNLDMTLRDIRDNITETLHHSVYPGNGIIRRSATVRNRTATPITTESAQSATFNLPAGEGYRLTYLSGRWAAENANQSRANT